MFKKVTSLAFEIRETPMDTGFVFSLTRKMSQLIHSYPYSRDWNGYFLWRCRRQMI